MSWESSVDSFAESGSDAFASSGSEFSGSSPISFADNGADRFAGSESSFSSAQDSFSNSQTDHFASDKTDRFASSGSELSKNNEDNSHQTGGFLGYLRKTFDAFASSSNVDDAYATGADDAFANDLREKEAEKYKAFFGTFTQLDIKNSYGNSPTTIVTGVGYGKFGNKLSQKGIEI